VVLDQLEGHLFTDWGNGASIATVQVDAIWRTLGIPSVCYLMFSLFPPDHTP
jgi:hypothetical protein